MNRYLELEASAGSGKTFALSVRFVASILSGTKINRILALTFTNKAANEMKARIIDLFLNLEHKKAELEELKKLFLEQDIINLRDRYLSDFLSANLRISTIDSFFAKIVRLFAGSLGLSPDFKLTERLELDDLLEKEIDEKQLALYLFEQGKSYQDFIKELELLFDSNFYLEVLAKKRHRVNFKEKLRRLEQIGQDILIKIGPHKYSYSYVKRLSQARLLFIDESLLLGEQKYKHKHFYSHAGFNELRIEILKDLNQFFAYRENRLLEYTQEIMPLFKECRAKIHAEKNELAFKDLEHYLLKIIKNNAEFRELLYFRLSTQLTHILIDEFQDTSLTQFEILKPLIVEVFSGMVDDEKGLFYVGDKKQSIYRFRGAMQEVFDLPKSLPNANIKTQALLQNYRSDELLVDFFNSTFSKLFTNYSPQAAARVEESPKGYIQVFERSDLQYTNIAEAIFSLFQKGVAAKDICILYRREGKPLKMLLNVLQKLGIKVNPIGSDELMSNTEVRLLTNYINYCLYDIEAYKHAIESFGLNSEKIDIEFDEGVASTYIKAAKALGLKLSPVLLQFISLVNKERNFLSSLNKKYREKSSIEQKDGISVMSMHKSKGLEFHTVILIDSEEREYERLKIDYDFKELSWFASFNKRTSERKIRLAYEAMAGENDYSIRHAKINLSNLEQHHNLLYVACTRAKHNLLIFPNTLKREKAEGKYSRFLEPISEEAVLIGSPVPSKQEDIETLEPLMEEAIALIDIEPRSKPKLSFSNKDILLGEALHLFLELLDIKGSNLAQVLLMLKAKYELSFSSEDFLKLKEQALSFINNPLIKELSQNAQILKEFSYKKNGQIKRIDLLFIKGQEAFLIDYKSGSLRSEHKKQIQGYTKDIKELKPELFKITSYLAYLNEVFYLEEVL